MADKIPNEVIDTELLNTGKNRKRELSISESEFEYNDHTDTFNCETSTNKTSLYKDNQSNDVNKRISEPLSDVIQKLTLQIEHIENNFAKCQNGMKNSKVSRNDVSCDDEYIYQPPNKIMKYDNDIISADFCNSDEKSIGSANKINTRHVNKKIKLDKNIIFQKDFDDSERDSKSLTNEEVEMLSEFSYKIDEEIIYDDTLKRLTIKEEEMLTNLVNNEDDKLGIEKDCTDKAAVFETCEDYIDESISKKLKNLDDLLEVTAHASDENDSFISGGKSMSNCNDCSATYSMNQSDEFVNVGDFMLVPEMCEDNVDDSIDQDDILDTTKCENDETILNHDVNEEMMLGNESDTSKKNPEQKNEGTLKRLTIKEEEMLTNLVNNEDDKLGIEKDCTDKAAVFQTCEDYIDESISKKLKNLDDLLEVTAHASDENDSFISRGKSMSNCNDCSATYSMNQSDEFVNVGDFMLVPEMCEDNVDDCIDQDDILDTTKCENDETILNHDVNEEMMLGNESDTSKKNPEQKNEGTLKRLTIEEEEMLTNLVNNEDDKLGIEKDCTDEAAVFQICEDYIDERNSQSSVTGDQFISKTFYFGTENCRDVSVHTIHSLDAYEMNNTLRNNTTVHSMKNNDSLVSLNNEIGNSIIELYYNSDNKSLSGINNKSDGNEDESVGGTMKQTIDDIAVSLESSNSFRHGLINNDSVYIQDQRKTNTSIKRMLEISILDNDKIGFSTEDQSMSKSNDCSATYRTNQSDEFFNVGGFILVPEMCEDNVDNSIDQDDILDTTKCENDETILDHDVNEEMMLGNESDTSKTNTEQKNKGTLKRLTIKEEEMLTNLVNNDDDKLGIETDCTDKAAVFQTCEEYIDESISKKLKNQDNLLDITAAHASDENYSIISEGIRSDQADKLPLPINHGVDITVFNNSVIDDLTERNSQSSVTGDQFISKTFYFGTENCRDVSVHTIHSLDAYEMNNTLRNNTTVHSMKNNDSLVSLNNEIENSIIELYCNSDNKLLSGINNKSDCDEDESVGGTMKQTIDDIAVSLESSNSFCHGLINNDSVYIQDQRKTNTSIKRMLKISILDNDKIGFSTEDQSMSKSNDCSATYRTNQSDEFVNVGGFILVPEMCEDNVDNSIDQDDILDTTKCENDETILDHDVNEEMMLGNESDTSKTNPEQKNEGTLKRLIIEEEEMLTNLVNHEDDKLRIETDCTDEATVFQTCEDYIDESISKKLNNQDDLLEVTAHASDENYSIISGGKSLSFNSSDAKQILESSNHDSDHFDDSLLFKPSDRDLVRYGIECEEYEKSISQSLNNLENNVNNKEVIPQSINNLVSSSYVKDYEDNVIDFYDCELSSIENSDVEDNLLLSFEKDTSMDDCIFDKNQNKLKNATNSTSNEQTCDNNLKIPSLGSPSESCNNFTNVVETFSLIHSPSHHNQYNEIISPSISMNQMQMNPDDDDDKLESVNSNNTITSCNAISSINHSDNINNVQSNDLCINQGNFNEDQNLEDSISLNENNKNKSISGYNTQQNIKKSQKSYGDNESVSSMKITANCTIPKSNTEEIPKMKSVQSSSSDIDQNEIDKKKYLEEIIKNEQLLNKFDEKLDVNESAISPFISQSLAKSTNLKSALAKKAAAYININDMGDKALSTYLTQQTMTLDVLEVLHKSLDTCPSSGILMEDPEGLVVPLMPHQKHAIAWLIWRESQKPHGGILADDMGLGKTLSMISLILKSKEKQQDSLLPVVSVGNGRNDVIIGGTLVVCPASLINQWETEVKTKLKPGLLKVGQYYGVNRSFSVSELAKNDLVITSYHVVMWDHKIRQNTSPLYKIKWDRIILDEGHNIRNHKTQTSVAVCNIKSVNRWAITGTPIHNKEADFFTLLKFVRCKPFDDWSVWKRWVGNNDDAGKHRLSLLVKTLMLRRTKSELTQFTTFNLPTKEINTIEIELSKEERNAYEKLLQFSSNLFATYLYDRAAKEKVFDPSIKVQSKVQYFQEQNQDQDEVFKDHPELIKLLRQFKNLEEIQTYHILVLLLRLRQICCHPTLIKGPITEDSIKKEDNMESIPEDDTDVTNNDLYTENTDIKIFPNNIDLSDLMSCLTLEDEPVKKKPVIDNNIFQKSWISTKIKKICDLVNQKVLINGNQEKAIIVSQWPSFLYLIYKHLNHYNKNAKMEIFSGAVPIPKRNIIIRDFNKPDGGPQILLLSLKAGGVGLNLMAANHLFLVDIHWNPQLEAQACDRVYRVGQTKPVYIYKFICSNTIETRIMNIQTHKLQIADNLFKGTNITSKITIDDLKQIFQFH